MGTLFLVECSLHVGDDHVQSCWATVYGGKCFALVIPTLGISRWTSQEICEINYGNLANIKSNDEQDYVADFLNRYVFITVVSLSGVGDTRIVSRDR